MLFCACYSVTAFIGHMLNHLPVDPILLPIPPEKWYLVQTFTTIPIDLAGASSHSALAYIFCRAIGGKGTFNATFATQAYTLHVPCAFLMWLPETFLMPILFAMDIHTVPWPEWVETLRVFVVPFLWIFYSSAVALGRIHGIIWWKGLIVVLISLSPTAMIMAVFIR